MSTVSTKTVATIIAEIDNHIRKQGGSYSSWYCGIAAIPRDRLFNDHNVQEHGGSWIYREAASDTKAREVEKHFLDKGCKGGGGGGDHTTRHVYAYRITSTTRE